MLPPVKKFVTKLVTKKKVTEFVEKIVPAVGTEPRARVSYLVIKLYIMSYYPQHYRRKFGIILGSGFKKLEQF